MPQSLRRAAAILLPVLLGGCATVVDIADRHSDANLVQERVINQQLLLNVVRAAHRQPLHFSRVPYVRLPLAQSAPWELTFPFGVVGAYGRNTAKTSVGGQVITVELVPQDSQEFIQGLTAPVRPQLMDLFLSQGWPQQVVLYLFIEELRVVELTDNKVPRLVQRIRNDPLDADAMRRFGEEIDRMTEHCDLALDSTPGSLGPKLSPSWLQNLTGVPEAVAAGLLAPAMQESSATFQLRLGGSAYIKLLPKAPGKEASCTPAKEGGEQMASDAKKRPAVFSELMKASPAVIASAAEIALRRTELSGAPQTPPTPSGSGQVSTTSQRPEIVLRSPESMVYYLGELARVGATPATVRGSDPARPATLFRVTSADSQADVPGSVAVAVEYWDRHYWVERTAGSPTAASPVDRSMQTLGLLAQVLQLQNRATTSPRSAAPLRVEALP